MWIVQWKNLYFLRRFNCKFSITFGSVCVMCIYMHRYHQHNIKWHFCRRNVKLRPVKIPFVNFNCFFLFSRSFSRANKAMIMSVCWYSFFSSFVHVFFINSSIKWSVSRREYTDAHIVFTSIRSFLTFVFVRAKKIIL